jgi:hypothetical protein
VYATKKIRGDFVARACALIAPVRPVLHQFSCGDETVRNALEHKFRVQCGGSVIFVAIESKATSLHELVH